MPPLPNPTNSLSTERRLPLVSLRHLFEVFLLLALFSTASRSAFLARRRRRMTSPGMGQSDLPINQEKKLAIHQRKDSYQEEAHLKGENVKTVGATLEEKSSIERQNDVFVRRPSLDREPNQYLHSLQQETLQPVLSPIYPWISPPQNLPGPYDAPYYPVPLPTIKTEESLHDRTQSTIIKTEPPSEDVPEELSTISFTRRVSPNSIPDQESLLERTVTVSTKGWRRTQWTVTAG